MHLTSTPIFPQWLFKAWSINRTQYAKHWEPMVFLGDVVLFFIQIRVFFCKAYWKCLSFTTLSLFSDKIKILYHLDIPETSNEEQLAWTKAEAYYICACPNYSANNKCTRKEQINEGKKKSYFLTNIVLTNLTYFAKNNLTGTWYLNCLKLLFWVALHTRVWGEKCNCHKGFCQN